MSKNEHISFAKKLIAGYQKSIIDAQRAGIFEESEDYTWQQMLEDNTGVYIEDISELEMLSDIELQQIMNAYT